MRPMFIAALLVAGATQARSASLQVAPVLLDVKAPGAATTLTVRNTDVQPITVQVRVFRWTQVDGQERFEPADEVVASPPVVELRSRQDYTVRIVRVAGRPVTREEAYRVVVDELPDPRRRVGAVSLVLRHAVPLFFAPRDAAPADIAWSLSQHAGGLTLSALNRGDNRVRLAAVGIRDAGGRVIPVNKGLLGYALGRSAMRWTVPATGRPLAPGAGVIVSGLAETGPFDAPSSVQAPR